MTTINNPHDTYFRANMSDPRIAKDFFLHQLPNYILQLVNQWKAFECQPCSFVDEELKKSMADVLYSVEFNDKPGYLYVLTEHQSTPDPLMPFRLIQYIFQIMRQHLKKGYKELPVVFPLVFYNGQKQWIYSTDFFTLFGEHGKLARSILFQPFHLINVNEISDEQLLQCGYASVFQLMQKHIYDDNPIPALQKMASLLQDLAKKNEKGYIKRTLNYLFHKDGDKRRKVVHFLKNEISKPLGDKTMTLVEYYTQRGERRGEKRGEKRGENNAQKTIATNLLREGLNIQLIAKATNLSINEIQLLEAEIAHS